MCTLFPKYWKVALVYLKLNVKEAPNKTPAKCCESGRQQIGQLLVALICEHGQKSQNKEHMEKCYMYF